MKIEILSTLNIEAGINTETAINIISSAPKRYKVFSIEKRRTDKKRVIAHPSKELKIIQRLIINKISEQCLIHNCAHAYIKGKSIKTNAMAHVRNQYILKMDFKNFFPNIKPVDFIYHLKQNSPFEIAGRDETIIELLFFWFNSEKENLELSIGAPSSPFISNFVMYQFDVTINEFCQSNDVIYTRYADDLCFSTKEKNKLREVEEFVKKTASESIHPILVVNNDKTIHSSKKHNRHITGLTLTNDQSISLGRERKRLYRVLVHKFLRSELGHEETESLKGFLAFASDVEPVFLERLKKMYGAEVIEKLVHSSKSSNKAKGDYVAENLSLQLMQASSDVANRKFEDALKKLSLIINEDTDYINKRIQLIKCEAYYRLISSYASLKKIEDANRATENFEQLLNRNLDVQSARYLARAYRDVYTLCLELGLSQQGEVYKNSHLALLAIYPDDFEMKRTAFKILQE
jgi:retron-type reverse transcriptase